MLKRPDNIQDQAYLFMLSQLLRIAIHLVTGVPHALPPQVSGKVWKGEAEKRASADKNAILGRGSSWEKKMQAKALKKSFQEQKQAAVDALKDKRKVRAASSSSTCAAHPATVAGA
jgi:hypothetical protein